MRVVKNENYKAKQLSESKSVVNQRFENCQFEKCNWSEYSFTNCEFEDCVFTSCNFTKAFLALNKNYDSGKFVNCVFITCNLTATSFRFPIIDNCEFRNCKLNETNFDGSRFSNSKFVGELDSCFFRGYSIYARGALLSFSKFDPLKVPNKMLNVDFSQATLTGVLFANKIDVSNCIFPKGDEYIFIKDLKGTMTKALEIVNRDWPDGQEKDAINKVVPLLYYSKDKQEQSNDFIDAHIMKESDEMNGNKAGMKFFDLIRSLQ